MTIRNYFKIDSNFRHFSRYSTLTPLLLGTILSETNHYYQNHEKSHGWKEVISMLVGMMCSVIVFTFY
jgi:hypothetical protein